MGETDLDKILDELGQFGKFQIVTYLLITIPMVYVVISSMSFVFTSGDLDYRCRIPECDAGNSTEFRPPWLQNAVPMELRAGVEMPSKCLRYAYKGPSIASDSTFDTCQPEHFLNTTERCDEFIFDGQEVTIVNEWNITCEENKWKLTLAGTLIFTGALLSKPASGYVSDRFGRKVLLLGGLALACVTGAVRGMSNGPVMFQVCNLLEGIFGGGIYSAAFVMGMEILGPKKRVLGGAIMSSYNAVGEVAMGAIAWWLQSWWKIHVFIYSPAFLFILYIWLLPESIRWLLAKGKKEKAEAIIRKAAKMNNVTLSEEHYKNLTTSLMKLSEVDSEDIMRERVAQPSGNENGELLVDKTGEPVQGKKIEPEPNKKGIFAQALNSRILMIRLLIASYVWACVGFTFQGMTFNSTSLAGNKYVNFMLTGLIEVPGHLLNYFGMDYLGRKLTLCISLVASGVCCLLFIVVPADKQWLAVGLYMFGKFSITASYAVLYMYAAELFPTPLRHSMLSACSMIGGIGAIAAPQAPLLATIYDGLPLIIFGGTALTSAVLTLLLPETKGVKLPDTIEEAENLGKKKPTSVEEADEGI